MLFRIQELAFRQKSFTPIMYQEHKHELSGDQAFTMLSATTNLLFTNFGQNTCDTNMKIG